MIRNEDLHHYLAVVSKALSGPIMNDLQSVPVKELTGAVLVVLDRILTDMVAGDSIALEALPEWEKLKKQTAKIVGPAAVSRITDTSSQPSGWQELDNQIALVQKALGNDAVFDRFVDRLKGNHRDTRHWMRDMSNLLAKLARNFETRLGAEPPVAANNAGGDRNVELKQKLGTYLKRRYPSLPDNPVENLAVVSGGQSKLSALLTLAANDALPQHLALRLDIPNTSTPMRLDTEYPVLKRVFELGLPVPEPILFEPDPVYLGDAFVLMTQIRDAKMAGSPFVEDRLKYGANTGPEFGREAAQLIATLHSRTLEPAAMETSVARERDALVAELSASWRTLEKSSFSLAGDLAIAWLRSHPLPPGRPVCLVHGDYVQHNILTRDGHIAALLDWELAMLGDPAADMAQCKMMLIGGVIDWEAFVRAYLEHGGLPAACDPHAVAYYAVLLYLKHSVYQGRIRNLFVRGQGADAKGAIISGHFVDRLALYQAEALRDAIAALD